MTIRTEEVAYAKEFGKGAASVKYGVSLGAVRKWITDAGEFIPHQYVRTPKAKAPKAVIVPAIGPLAPFTAILPNQGSGLQFERFPFSNLSARMASVEYESSFSDTLAEEILKLGVDK